MTVRLSAGGDAATSALHVYRARGRLFYLERFQLSYALGREQGRH